MSLQKLCEISTFCPVVHSYIFYDSLWWKHQQSFQTDFKVPEEQKELSRFKNLSLQIFRAGGCPTICSDDFMILSVVTMLDKHQALVKFVKMSLDVHI